ATLQADIENLRAIKESQILTVQVVESIPLSSGDEPYIVANDNYENYRAILVFGTPYQELLQITKAQAKQLKVENGGLVRVLSVHVKQDSNPQIVNKIKETEHLRMAVN
ncbi:arginine N-succinyltransferase, partial [Acinetobacter baumannii]|uniref:arginine N-succinyltransferase n=1 Tax=Acinetobacter baumannii TaxID=470 RepID=UPI00148F3601